MFNFHYFQEIKNFLSPQILLVFISSIVIVDKLLTRATNIVWMGHLK